MLVFDAESKSRVFTIGGGANVILSGMTITGGLTEDYDYGGGIMNFGNLTVRESTVSGNSAYYGGGGIYNVTGCTLTVTHSKISNNFADYGGGIYNAGTLFVTDSEISENTTSYGGGGINNSSTLTVMNSTISGNSGRGIASSGEMTITKSTISDNTGGGISGSGNNNALTVTNCIITGNSTTSSVNGGGIYYSGNYTGELTVTDSTISGNSAYYGGGIYTAGEYRSPIITNCVVSENSANSGGGIYNSATNSLKVTNCTISENHGGGIYSTLTNALTVSNCTINDNNGSGIWNSGGRLGVYSSTISGNSAYQGGGISNPYNSGVLTVMDCTLSGNLASSGGGGIFYGNSTDTLTVSNCTITGNSASYGGGIHSGSGLFTMTNSSVSGNSVSERGGGISNNGTLTMTNCIISGNSAASTGGIYNGSRPLTMTNCTISGNSAGGVYNHSGPLTLYNTIVAKNSLEDISHVSGTLLSYNNLIGNGTGLAALVNDVDGNVVGTAVELIDPRFAAIPAIIDATTTGNNYNPADWDLQLTSQSPAVNSGNNEYIEGWTHDLAGSPRIRGSVVDMGAYEYDELPSVVVTTLDDTINAYDGLTSLREAMMHAGTNGLGMTITFDSSLYGQAVVLGGTSLYIDKDITIDATDVDIIIDADRKSRVFTIAANTTVELVGLTITNGTIIDSSSGGGIYNSGTLTVTDCTISGNSGYSGGGIYNAGILTITNGMISGNSASSGGGIYNSGSLTMKNCVISGNAASSSGGGIFSASTMSLYNNTIAGNVASSYGGGIYSGAMLLLYNTIVARNTSQDIFHASGHFQGNNNLIGNGTGQKVLLHGVNGNIVGSNVNSVSPQFVATPSINSTTTGLNYNPANWNLRVRPNSPVIDKGGNTYFLTASDLDGKPRILDDTVDIGAYEFSIILLDTPVLDTVTPIGSNTISVVWDAVANASGYMIQYATDTEFTVGVGTLQAGASATSATIPWLSASTTYYIRIMAIAAGMYTDSDYSAAKSTATEKIKLTEPRLASVTATGSTTASIVWDAVANAGGYTIQYTTDMEFTTDVGTITVDPSDHWAEIPGLTAMVTYYVRIMATATGDYSDSDYSTAMPVIPVELPSVVVTTLDDIIDVGDDLISLREAIAYAGTDGLGTAITFDSSLYGQTIVLNGSELSIAKNIVVDGSGMSITLDADRKSRVFDIAAGAAVELMGLTITNGRIIDDGSGGAIFNAGTLVVMNCIITGNSASSGGGIYNSSMATVINSMVLGNSASHGGGGIYSDSGILTLTNSTIAGNSASYAGGIYNSSGTTLHNTIVAKNSSDIYDDGVLLGYNNLIGDGMGQSWLVDGVNGNIVGADPRFVLVPATIDENCTGVNFDPANWELRLLSRSPAINAGNGDFAVDAHGNPLAMDLAGDARIFDKAIDIGAYESTEIEVVMPVTGMIAATPFGSEMPAIHEWQRFWNQLWTVSPLEGESQIVLAYDANLFVPEVVEGVVQYEAAEGVTLTFGDATYNAVSGLTEWTITVEIGAGFVWPGEAALLGSVAFTPATEAGSGVSASDIFRDAASSPWLTVNGESVLTDVWAVPYDLTDDGVINIYDLIQFAKDYGPATQEIMASDFDCNKSVDIYDLIQFAKHYGISVADEKASIAISRMNTGPLPAMAALTNDLPQEFAAMFGLAVTMETPAETVPYQAVLEIVLTETPDVMPATAETGIVLTAAVIATPQLPETVVVERPAELPVVPALSSVAQASAVLPLVANAVLSRVLPEIAGKSAVDRALLDMYDGPAEVLASFVAQPQVGVVSDAVFEGDYDWNEAADDDAEEGLGDYDLRLAMFK